MNKKNIVIIMADQLRYDVFQKGYTPNIDQLVSESISFTNAYCGSPLCVPSRGSFFTGLYPNTNGSLINPWYGGDKIHGNVKAGIDNLYTMYEREDYCCIHSGKQHLFTEGEKLENKKDSHIRWAGTDISYRKYREENNIKAVGGSQYRSCVPEMASGKYTRMKQYSNPTPGYFEGGADNYADGYFTNQIVTALKERDTSKPLFVSAMFINPHPPFQIPSPYYEKFCQGEDVQMAENVNVWYPKQSPLQMYNLTGVIGSKYNQEEWQKSWNAYMGLVNMLDDSVGKIVEELKLQEIYDDTTIVFTSDHGEMLGSHKLFQKMCMYQESVKVPLAIKMPQGEYANKKIHNIVSHIDIAPTLCDVLGNVMGHDMEGESLLPLIQDESTESRNIAFIQFDGNGARSNFQRCIVEDGYKLIMDVFKDETYFELYQVDKDIFESENLIFEQVHLEKGKQMLVKLLAHMKETNDLVVPSNTDLEEFIVSYQGF